MMQCICLTEERTSLNADPYQIRDNEHEDVRESQGSLKVLPQIDEAIGSMSAS